MANSDLISILKRKIKNEIVNDPLIVKAIESPNYDPSDLDYSGEDVGQNYIFSWNRNIHKITDTITFLTIQVNIRKYKDNWVKPQIIITIFSHNDHMILNPIDFPGIAENRNDYLSRLIDNKFNGRTTIGLPEDIEKISLLEELELSSNNEGLLNDTFAFRQLIFETKDMNYSICGNRQ